MLYNTINGVNVPLTEDEIIEFKKREDGHMAEREAYKLVKYKDDRLKEYPLIDDMVVSLWKLIVEQKPESVAELQEKRELVKAKFPPSK